MQKYAKIKIVGKGSFGHAVLVQDVKRKKPFVMKIIDINKMDKKQKAQALNQVHVFKQLKFPYVISYRESFIQNGHLCIVMDYADGGDLYSKIAKQKEVGVLFPQNLIINWFIKMALALRYVHDRKILHRDLKTQNIFLTTKGDVKIGDFGIARVLQHTYDCANTAIGTPYYLSPQICQQKPYNQKSDIWSLGCILYEMTTLNHAFDSNNMKGLIQKILKGNYPPIPPQYSQDLRQVIASLLIKDPSKRPSMKKILQLPFIKSRINQLLASTVTQYGNFTSNPIYRIMSDGESSSQPSQQIDKQIKDPTKEREKVGDSVNLLVKRSQTGRSNNISIITVRKQKQKEKLSPSKNFSALLIERNRPNSKERERMEKERQRQRQKQRERQKQRQRMRSKRDKQNSFYRKSDDKRHKKSMQSDEQDPTGYGQLINEMKKCLDGEGEEEKEISDGKVVAKQESNKFSSVKRRYDTWCVRTGHCGQQDRGPKILSLESNWGQFLQGLQDDIERTD